MDKLDSVLWQAERHAEILAQALAEWDAAPAGDWEALEADKDRVRLLDQLLFRFMKLQDALGERLVPATLAVLGEPFEDRPMRDRLNRLEKLGYLDADDWFSWREIRNRLAHEYPDHPELRYAALLAAIDAARALVTVYRGWRMHLESDGMVAPRRTP